MEILKSPIAINDLKHLAGEGFGDLVKAVVDVEQKLLAIDAELHSDLEAVLLENGSAQEHLWGINLYPELEGDDFVEFDSMINLRPSQGNMSRGVDSKEIQKKILSIVSDWIRK